MTLLYHLKKAFEQGATRHQLFAVLFLFLSASPVLADWPNTNATKWLQYPNTTTNGIDVFCARAAAGNQPIILADDFLCTQTGPIDRKSVV